MKINTHDNVKKILLFRKHPNNNIFLFRTFWGDLFIFFTEDGEMHVAFRVRFEVNKERVRGDNRCVYMIVERFVINQLSERALLRAYVGDESVDAFHGGVQIGRAHV